MDGTEKVRPGTYPVTLPAGNWITILTALRRERDTCKSLDLPETAADLERVWKQVFEQVS